MINSVQDLRRPATAATKMKGRRAEVEIITEAYRIKGTLFIPLSGQGGYRSRLSDLLNSPDKQFLPITNASVEVMPEPEIKWEAPFLAINKSIVTIVRAIKE